jgi:hypothetical protein
LALAAFTAVALLLAAASSALLNDPDTHWHVATGRWIVENAGFPRTDPFSHSFAGQPWIAKEWLSQLALFGAHAVAGWSGVAALAALSVAASIGLIAASLARRVSAVAAIAMVALIVMSSAPSFLARPHVVALPLLALWTLGMIRAAEERRAPRWPLLIVMALWANAHAGFTIGFVIALALGLEAVRDAGAGRRLSALLAWARFGALAVLASCATPYGAEAILVTIKLFGGGEPLPLIGEWRPMTMDGLGLARLGLCAALIGALALQFRRNLFRIALTALLGWMMLRHERFALLFAFVALPVAAGPLAATFAALAPSADGAPPRRLLTMAAGAAALLGAAALAMPAPAPSPRVTPASGLEAARKAGLVGPVFNAYDFGGYLISQGVPTFIDGRTDQLFLGGFFRAFSTAYDGLAPDEPMKLAARHGVTWALVEPASPAAARLEAAGWRVVHRDAVSVVLARPGTRP